ncbi:hypothetical protein GALMADRAFT_872765 [Galerina marginata CBS 339.88]|uniref:PH domain-containing protein n=1 Tax=Galerina marginata (strain CBS 339.88) TaxID=685588 RepID=A0A067TJ12_GALM3|nr:hypothetical protein GALMADRAFT_872765 [Galerina marginata CBS 339.88]
MTLDIVLMKWMEMKSTSKTRRLSLAGHACGSDRGTIVGTWNIGACGWRSLGLGLERLSDLDNDLDRDAVDSRRGDSTRSSSSHPSLSRTRSSSDDSDMLRSPVMGDYDYSFFPYSRAMALQSLYGHQHHPSDALFAAQDEHGLEQEYNPAAASEAEATSSFAVRPAEVDVSQGTGFGFDRVAGEVLDEKKLDPENEARSVDVSRTTAFINGLRSDEGLDAYLNSPSASSYDPEFAVASSSSSLDHHHHQRTSSPIPPMPSTNLAPHTTPPSPDHLSLEKEHATTTMSPVLSTLNGEPCDSSGYRRHPPPALSSTSQSSRTGSSHGQTSTSNRSNGFGSAYSSTTSRLNRGRQRGNSDDEDDDEDRRRRRALERMHVDEFGLKSPSSSEDEDDMDKYGPPSASSPKNNLLRPPWNPGPVSRTPSTAESFVTAPSGSPSPMPMDFPSTSSNSSRYASEDDDDDDNDDDDVPLAQRIPGALIAQKSMRHQFRQEREQRKQEKTVRQETEADRRARQMTLRPAGAGAGGVVDQSGVGTVGSSSHDAALLAVAAAAAAASLAPPTAPAPPQRRQRTLTLPTKSPGAPIFNPHDLAKKLQNVQMAESPAHQLQTFQQQQIHHHHQQQQQLSRSQTHHSKSISKSSGDQQHLLSPPFAASPPMSSPAMRSRSVKEPSNSLHQPFSASPTTSMHVPPVPALRSMRSFHRPSSSHRPAGTEGPRSSPLPEADQRLGRSSTTSNHRSSNEGYIRRSTSQSRISGERPMRTEEPVPPLPFNRSARPSIDHGTDREEQRKAIKGHPSPETRVHKRPSTADPERPRTSSSQHQPQPQLQPTNVIMKPIVSQQRIFVGNLQQFHMVEISPSTTAGDVITMMDSQGILKGWAGSGGWMVFEIAQDFGMERPVRSYELLADVQSSWLKDKTVNYFVLRLTPLDVPLSRSAIPSSSPTHSGYVEWEVKRGKWSKRWLQLREHSLWLSKRDNRKDEVLICSLSNFDAYHITRNHRAPKPYAFAIKSTDNLSFFESATDYLHNFSCSEKDGSVWMEKILVARSYVLHQEKQVLFSPKSPGGNASAPLARSGTKKHPPPRTLQPLIPLLHNDVFEPGSLLANHL